MVRTPSDPFYDYDDGNGNLFLYYDDGAMQWFASQPDEGYEWEGPEGDECDPTGTYTPGAGNPNPYDVNLTVTEP